MTFQETRINLIYNNHIIIFSLCILRIHLSKKSIFYCHRTDYCWGKRVLEWRQRVGKRVKARWSDDLRRTARRSWLE
jgi:hypothetical protein